MDFTADKFSLFLRSLIESQLPFLTFSDYLKKSPEKFVILRHDVDRAPAHALKMAGLEFQMGVKATYYFRYKPGVFRKELIKKIASMGHEIGYHYENLSDSHGDYEKAIQSFKDILSEFRKIVNVETISMHGKPLSKYNNQWLWKRFDFKDFGITGEPYFSVDYSKVAYFTDAGRIWNAEKVNFRDKVNDPFQFQIKSSDDIVQLIRSGTAPQSMIINIHPENWAFNHWQWGRIYLWRGLKNKVKYIIHFVDKRN